METSRRDVLRAAALTAIALPFAAACGSSTASQTAPADGPPKRGGRLRAAIAGGGAAETLHPLKGGSPVDFARNRSIYDPLFAEIDGKATPRLATSATPAPDGKSFQLTLRDGVTWHDGSKFTARDVAYTFRTLADPKFPFPNDVRAYVDVSKLTVVDDHTITVPVLRPLGDPATTLAAASVFVIKDGAQSFEPGEAVGTGPFRVVSFAAGRSATLVRYDRHWDGAPHLDELVFISLSDSQARVNAVQAGQADLATAIPYTAAETLKRSPVSGIEVRSAGDTDRTGFGLVLNATKAPFNDPRARKAMRLAVDREGLVRTILLGHGVPGNDLYGAGSQYFAPSKPLSRDVDQARRLLSDAGVAGSTITIRSTETESGVNESVTVLAQQLKDVGLTVNPQLVSPTEFGDLKAMAGADAVTLTLGALSLQTIYPRLTLVPSLTLPDPELKSALNTSLTTTDDASRARAWREVQSIMQDRGNLVVWGNAESLSLARTNVRGAQAWGSAKYPYLGKAWLA